MGSFFSSTGKQSSTSDSTQTGELDPRQNALNRQVFKQLMSVISAGPNVTQSDRNQARGQTNQIFNQNEKVIEGNLAARGFSGGKLGEGITSNELGRARALSSDESSLRDQAWQRFSSLLSPALSFMHPRTFTGHSTSTGMSSSTPSPFSILEQIGGTLASAAFL